MAQNTAQLDRTASPEGIAQHAAREDPREAHERIAPPRRQQSLVRRQTARDTWSPGIRLVGGVLGAVAVTRAFRLRGIARGATATLGLLLLARALTNRPLRRVFGVPPQQP